MFLGYSDCLLPLPTSFQGFRPGNIVVPGSGRPIAGLDFVPARIFESCHWGFHDVIRPFDTPSLSLSKDIVIGSLVVSGITRILPSPGEPECTGDF